MKWCVNKIFGDWGNKYEIVMIWGFRLWNQVLHGVLHPRQDTGSDYGKKIHIYQQAMYLVVGV